MESIKNLLKFTPSKPIKTKEWQFEALEAIKYFVDGKKKKSSIFKAFRDNPHKSKFAMLDCRELEKRQSAYFFKLINIKQTNERKKEG